MLMLPWSADLAGRIEHRVVGSTVLRGNPLGDPHERPLLVYVPPGYDDEPGRRYLTIFWSSGYSCVCPRAITSNTPTRMMRLTSCCPSSWTATLKMPRKRSGKPRLKDVPCCAPDFLPV
jgi:hypothetical protein